MLKFKTLLTLPKSGNAPRPKSGANVRGHTVGARVTGRVPQTHWDHGRGALRFGQLLFTETRQYNVCAKQDAINPVENVWQYMRDNWLSNRVFKSYDDLVDHCCEAWNKLVDQPWRIMSIGLRQWAHGF
jgi:hypothetical protein